MRPWEKLGAHPCVQNGSTGTAFAVWAPNARQVCVVGDFNHWDPAQHVMQHRGTAGVWEIFVPGVGDGALYKYSVLGEDGSRVLKTDPYALRTETGSGHACVVMQLPERVEPTPNQLARSQALTSPMSIYPLMSIRFTAPGAISQRACMPLARATVHQRLSGTLLPPPTRLD